MKLNPAVVQRDYKRDKRVSDSLQSRVIRETTSSGFLFFSSVSLLLWRRQISLWTDGPISPPTHELQPLAQRSTSDVGRCVQLRGHFLKSPSSSVVASINDVFVSESREGFVFKFWCQYVNTRDVLEFHHLPSDPAATRWTDFCFSCWS